MDSNEKIRGSLSDNSTGLVGPDFGQIGLEIDTNIDLSELSSFSARPVDIAGVADKIKSVSSGLEVDADLGKIDLGMRKIREQQKNAQIQTWIDEAQKAMDRQDYRQALSPLNKVVGADPTSGQGWFMLGYCHFALNEYGEAIEKLRNARSNAHSPDLLLMCLMLETLCSRAEAEALERQLQQLMEAGRTTEALALVEQQLTSHPSNPTFLYYRCGILLAMGNISQAQQAAHRALSSVHPTYVALFQDILTTIAQIENAKSYAEIRTAMRAGDWRKAEHLLANYSSKLAKEEQYQSLKIYVAEKASGNVRQGGLFSLGKPSLQYNALQSLLCWLLSDELNAGMQALNQGQFAAAHTAFTKAEKLDTRCSIICFLHALSLFRSFGQSMESKQPDIASALVQMQQAATLLETSVKDRTVGQQSRGLKNVVDRYLTELQKVNKQRQSAQREGEAIAVLFQEFNGSVEYYSAHPISSRSELQNAKQKMQDIKQRVTRLRGKYGRNTEPWQVLGKLEDAVNNVLRQLN